MVDIKQLETLYFANDKPVPYKLKCGVELMIYPVLVENWNEFSDALSILTIRKNEINDAEVIKMKYLDFMLMLSNQEKNMLDKLKIISKYSFKEDFISPHAMNGKNHLAIVTENNDIKSLINGKEFDDIKKIILHQNIYDYDDRYISPDVRQLYEEYVKATSTNQIDPTLERKKVFVIGKTGLSMKDINTMSYRIFNQLYIDNVNLDMYFARKIIQASQKYDVKEEPIYPLFEKPKDKYDKLFVQKDTIQNKLDKIQ